MVKASERTFHIEHLGRSCFQSGQPPGKGLSGTGPELASLATESRRRARRHNRIHCHHPGGGAGSIWQIEGAADTQKLTCLDLYRHSAAEHSNSVQLAASRYPAYFDALDQGRVIDAHDAANDVRTREFQESYLRPLGIGAMLDATLRGPAPPAAWCVSSI